jgi:hypothetical protein
VVGYIMGSPARRRAIKAKEAAEREANLATSVDSFTPNAHSEASGDPVAPVRKEP